MEMSLAAPEGAKEIRQLIHGFIQERLQARLVELDPDQHDERERLIERYQPNNWLANAAQRITKVQIASHTLKQIHPDARGTNLHVSDYELDTPGLVGTHTLAGASNHDVVGNAADRGKETLDVVKLLTMVEYDHRSLLDRAIAGDEAFKVALSDSAEHGESWLSAFASLAKHKHATASHTLAKQLYFPLPDGSYHLLGPLFPTTLVHRVYQTIREHHFGESAKAARKARKDGKDWPSGYCDYPDLAIQNFGGTKPQNISQLNSERRGENWLLPSKPPTWQSLDVKPPLNADSIFDGWFNRRRSVREAVKHLREFLANTKHNNLSIRQARARMVADICDEVHQYAATLREIEPGWSGDSACRLHEAEQLWLDPLRSYEDEAFAQRRLLIDWRVQVSKRFANWLNSAIESKTVKFDEMSAVQWADDLRKQLRMFEEVLNDDRD